MADIFLSYSKARREATAELARDLEEAGFSVWWDTGLLPTDDYRDEIDRHLDEAKAVIMIWTPESVHSRWVRAEADHADGAGKLINSHTPDLDPRQIPKPFNQLNSAPLELRAAIFAAAEKLGATRKPKPAANPSAEKSSKFDLSDEGVLNAIALEHWLAVKTTESPQRLRDFLTEFGSAKMAPLARSRLNEMEETAWARLPKPPVLLPLRQFLADFPDGAHTKLAEDLCRQCEAKEQSRHAEEERLHAEAEKRQREERDKAELRRQEALARKAERERRKSARSSASAPLAARVMAILLILVCLLRTGFLVNSLTHASVNVLSSFFLLILSFIVPAVWSLGDAAAGILVLGRFRAARAFGLTLSALGLLYQLYAAGAYLYIISSHSLTVASTFWAFATIYIGIRVAGIIVFARWHPSAVRP
jgi:hypothetical protein